MAERIAVVDGLRGFALLGILVINLGSFSNAPGAPPNFFAPVAPAERAVLAALVAAVESKFFSLFSLLFGLSFTLQIDSAARSHSAFGPRITRRLLTLLGFGVLHVVLLWDGDILIIYALVGALLIAFRNVTDRILLRWAAGLLAVPVVVYLISFTALAVARTIPTTAATLVSADQELVTALTVSITERTELLRTGSYAEIAIARWTEYLSLLGLLASRIPTILAMFLLGMWAGRTGLVRDPEVHLGRLRRIRTLAWTVGVPVQAAVVVGILLLPPINGLVCLFFNQALTGPVLAIAYATSLVLWSRRPTGARILNLLAYPGRMALTTYLTQSLILTLVFWSWGLALTGQVSSLQGLGIAAIIFTAQLIVARVWLARFRYGPLEWIWRCLTYANRQALRRTPGQGPSAPTVPTGPPGAAADAPLDISEPTPGLGTRRAGGRR
jgi:uncharacterized protein